MSSFKYYTLDSHEELYYYKIPKLFFASSTYKKLSREAKLLYMFLKDRNELSIFNSWKDEDGHIFFISTNEEMKEWLGVGHTKLDKIKKELEAVGLLKVRQMGLNRANRMYLARLDFSAEDVETLAKYTKRITEIGEEEMKKQLSENPEIPEIPKGKPASPTAARTSAKRKPGLPQNGNQDFRKTDTNYNDINYKDFILDDEDKAKQVSPVTLSNIEIESIEKILQLEFSDMNPRSFASVCSKIRRKHSKGEIKKDYEEYLRSCLENKIIELAARKAAEAAKKENPQQATKGRGRTRKEMLPAWAEKKEEPQQPKPQPTNTIEHLQKMKQTFERLLTDGNQGAAEQIKILEEQIKAAQQLN